MLYRNLTLKLCVPFFLLAAIGGCGPGVTSRPPLGTVSGVITLNGKPLENAMVSFLPGSEWGSSSATTDSDGRYELTQGVENEKGAVVGQHTVTIYAQDYAQDSEITDLKKTPISSAPQKNSIPDKYNINSTLKVDVKAGSNTFDFKLDAK